MSRTNWTIAPVPPVLRQTHLWIGHCTRCAFKVSGRTGDPALTEALCDHIDYVHEPAEQAA